MFGTMLHVAMGIVIEVPDNRVEWHGPVLFPRGIIVQHVAMGCLGGLSVGDAALLSLCNREKNIKKESK
jgi:hypothetical protein